MNNSVSNIDVSIVIVNYKSWHHLKNCLESIQKINTQEFTLEVIVVDNYSNDNQFEVFKNNFLEFNFIENSGNNGFANGCNLGEKKSNGNFLLFLNPDTIVIENSILKMITFLKENKDCGIVSCNQKNNNESYEKNIRFFPKLNTLFGILRAINQKKLYLEIEKNENVIYPNWVSGAVVLISKTMFNKVKGWNEDFWMYYEDVDLSKKVSNLGRKIALLSNVEIIHNHGASSRINIKTASITKTEVLISKHVYVNTHYKNKRVIHFILQFLIVVNNLMEKIITAIFGVIFFFIPKLRLNVYLFINLIKYYFASILNRTWLSFRSMNHPNKK